MTFGCAETERYVDAWADGELDPSAAAHVEAHLARCPGCREDAAVGKQLKRALAGCREDCAPTALRHRVLAALDADDDTRAVAESARRRKRHALGVALTRAALAGVVMAQGLRVRHGGGEGVGGGGEGPALAGVLPVLEDVARGHARELPAEVEGSDPAQVAQWFRGKLDIPVRPMAFRGMPARLVGARISNVRDRVAAALYYDVGGRRMTVFVFDGGQGLPRSLAATPGGALSIVQGRPMYVGSVHGYTISLTEREGVAYAIASDLPPRECARVVESADLR